MEKVYETTAQTAKKVRKALKEAFPGTKFSVRSHGGSIRVSWIDLPTDYEVETITNKFTSTTFDGMEDLATIHGYIMDGIHYIGADYIFTERKLSDEYKEVLTKFADNFFGDMEKTEHGYSMFNLLKAEKYMLEEEKKKEHEEKKRVNNLTPEEKILEDKLISNIEYLELCKKYNLQLSYGAQKWCEQQLDEIGYGTTIYKGFINEEAKELMYALYEKIEENKKSNQMEEVAVKENIEENKKIQVKSITFEWSEASHIIKDNTTVSTFAEANSLVKEVAFRQESEGYTKTAFIITWEDGRTHTGRIDIEQKHGYVSNPIGEHVKYFYEGLAGLKKPVTWTEEEYKNHLKVIYNIDEQGMEEMKRILETYALEDIPSNMDDQLTVKQPVNETKEEMTQAETSITATYTLNNEKNGVEIYFTEKPSEEVREQLKTLKSRWSRNKKCWYAKQSEETISLAKQLAGEEQPEQEKQPLNNIKKIMADIDQIEAISAQQKERIETLLNHWNEKEMAVLKAIYKQDDSIILKIDDLRSNNNKPEKHPKIFVDGSTHTGFFANDEQLKDYELLYTVNKSKNVYNSDTLLSPDVLEQLTPEQQETLSKRLQKDNLQPSRLYKSKDNDVIFECINTNLPEDKQKPFYFLIDLKGNEHGKGYAYQLDGCNLIHTFKEQESNITVSSHNGFVYPEIDIDDVHMYIIDEQLSKRENESSSIFRTKDRNHTKELQDLFTHYNRLVIEFVDNTDNEYYKFKAKEALQRFKKKYYETYVKYLTMKSNNPGWAITGRAGINKRRYDKAMARQDKHMLELADMPNQLESKLKHYKHKIKKDKLNQIKQQAQQTTVDIEFKAETKEFEFMGIKERKRVYTYNNYWIVKTWGCFRIFKGNKEIHSMKTTETLQDAKKYACYLIHQEKAEKTA